MCVCVCVCVCVCEKERERQTDRICKYCFLFNTYIMASVQTSAKCLTVVFLECLNGQARRKISEHEQDKTVALRPCGCLLIVYLWLFQQLSPNATDIWLLNSVNNQGSTFQEGQISYYTTGTYVITLDLKTLGGHGYIVLDDFTFKSGMCRGQSCQKYF